MSREFHETDYDSELAERIRMDEVRTEVPAWLFWVIFVGLALASGLFALQFWIKS